jgi:adenosyl cobinamide kinase/adenosyl cobinamide phosphate guanylyltransferase
MTTPTKSEILAKALEIWKSEQYQHGTGQLADINPEPSELAENGFIAAAQSSLMSSPYKKYGFEEKQEIERPLEKTTANFDEVLDVDALLRSGLVIFGGSGCGKSTLAKAIVRRLAEKGVTSYIVDTSMTWLKESYDIVPVSRDCRNYTWRFQNTVFDCAELTMNERIIFVDSLARELLDVHMTGTIDRPEILVFEEAELFLSNNNLRSKKLENVLTFVSTGRNFNLRFIAVSPVPSLIDKLIVKLTEQKIFGRASEPNDLAYIKKILPKPWTEELKSLTVGNFISENKGRIQRCQLDIGKPCGWASFTYQQNLFALTETFK